MKKAMAAVILVFALLLTGCAAAPKTQSPTAAPSADTEAGAKEIVLTKDNFDDEIAGDTPILVDFWASWCGPCMRLAPIVEELAAASDGSYRVGKLNVDEQPELAARFGVDAIPRLIVFKNGEIKAERLGLTDRDTLMEMINGAK